MNTKEALKLLNITDDQFELSVEKLTKINQINDYIKESQKYRESTDCVSASGFNNIILGTNDVTNNIHQAKEEILNIAFEGFTTRYTHHNSDIANLAMYKLADWLQKDDFYVWNSTYGNDQFASITVDFASLQKKVQIFVPNSTKFDGDNEEDNQYWVQPKNADDESIMEGQYFDIHDLSGIEKYCTALYKFWDAQQDLEILQA